MKTLSFFFGIASILNAAIAYLPPYFAKGKEYINQRFLSLCIKFKDSNDDELALAIKPLLFGAGCFVFVLAAILLQLWGEQDQDVKELSFTWFGVLSFTGLALISSKEFSKRLKETVRISFKYTLWVTGIGAFIMIIVFSFVASYHAHINHQPLDPELTAQWIVELLFLLLAKPVVLAFVIIMAITTLIFSAIPFIFRTVFLLFIRKVVHFILLKETKDPIKVPLLISSIFFLLLAIYTHLSSKGLH